VNFSFINFKEIKVPKNKRVTNHEILTKDKEFTLDGIFSPEIFGDNRKEEIACECGELKGKFNLGSVCQKCQKEVIQRESNTKKYGWIKLKKCELIQPVFYEILGKLFNVEKIISPVTINEEENTVVYSPYDHIGIRNFKIKFDEILKHFKSIAKVKNNWEGKRKYFNFIKRNKEYIFTDKVLVISVPLRPAHYSNEKFFFDEINNYYNYIIKDNETIKTLEENEKFNNLRSELMFDMQSKYMELYKIIIKKLNGKNGIIRNFLLGYRTNFSARSVIAPIAEKHSIDEVHLPYLEFMELYKYHMINLLRRVRSVSFNEAYHLWHAYLFNPNDEIYDLIDTFLEKSKPEMMLGRNPTIYLGSILSVRITKVKRDPSDLTKNISNNTLILLAGDYDGDTLNDNVLLDEGFKNFLRPLNPRNLVLNLNDGKINRDLLLKDQQLEGIYTFLN